MVRLVLVVTLDNLLHTGARERIRVHGLPSKMELKKVRKFKIHGMKKHLIAYTLCS